MGASVGSSTEESSAENFSSEAVQYLFFEPERHRTGSDTKQRATCISRVESWRGELSPFPAPAHRTGRADFPHPALRLDSLQRYRWDASSCTAHFMHSQIAEDRRVLELTGAPRGHLVTPLQKVSHSRSHMGIHGSIALAFAAVAEISLSPLQHSIEPVAHLRPRPRPGSQCFADLGFEPLHTLT